MRMGKNKFTIIVGKKIRAERERQAFSQEGFADHIHFDRSNYGAIERGERNISVYTLGRIAKGLGVEIGILLPALSEVSQLLDE